jgi:hypothetical protein
VHSALLPLESHLSDADVVDYAAGRSDAAARAQGRAHLAVCSTCAREVGELQAWAAGRRRVRPFWYAAAAAALLTAVLAPVLMRSRAPSRPTPDTPSSPASGAMLAGLDGLPTAQREQVEAALRDGVAPLPPSVARLARSRERLMGPDAAPSPAFRLLEPTGTAVVTDRPAFRWEPLPGARDYTVAVFDEALRPVARASALSETTWTPEGPLPRGQTYTWQVTAYRASGSVTAPAPPEPPATVHVLATDTARLLDQTAAAHPGAHLLVGILYAQAGVRAEAEKHLAQVPATDPHAEVARRTLERVRGLSSPTP